MRRKKYVGLEIIVAITLPLTIVLLTLSTFKTTISLKVKENGNVDYQICLKENDYYPNQCLDKGMQYIANLIDYIDIDFKYDLTTNHKIDSEYSYRVESEVRVFAKNDPTNIIYTDTEELLKEKVGSTSDKSLIQVQEKFKIDYDEYNDLVRKFKSEYGVNADSSIQIRLYITPVLKYKLFDAEVRKEESVLELSIPLTESQINITANLKNVNESNDFKDEVVTVRNYVYLGCAIVSGFIALSLLIQLILVSSKRKRNRTPYQKAVDKILREYDDIISESDTIIDPYETEYQYIDCKDFKELKDMALNTGRQIIFSELKELGKPHRSWFYIIDEANKMIYRTSIRSDDKNLKSQFIELGL